jgi:cohesin loading factor subunit SCC2
LHEKHESLIDTCYVDGIKQAFTYQKTMHSDTFLAIGNASFTKLYDILRTSRKGRRKFLIAICKSIGFSSDHVDRTTLDDAQFAFFVVQNMTNFTYSTNEEVHIVLHTIDRTLSSTGVSLLHTIETSTDGPVSENSALAGLEFACTILCYLMKLRMHLMAAYSITESKCRAFNPHKLGNKPDTKVASRQPDVPPSPKWAPPTAKVSQGAKVQEFLALFRNDLYHIDQHSSDAQSDTADNLLEQIPTIEA